MVVEINSKNYKCMKIKKYMKDQQKYLPNFSNLKKIRFEYDYEFIILFFIFLFVLLVQCLGLKIL